MRAPVFAFAFIVSMVSCQWIAGIDDKTPGPAAECASTSSNVDVASASGSTTGGCGRDAGGSGGSGGAGVCLMTCEGVCVDSLTDRNHCGSCNVVCPVGEACEGGICGRSLFRGVGSDSPCAVVSGGTLYCWGANDDYQAGLLVNESPATFPFKAKVTLPKVRYAASSSDATCALLETGGVSCWGANSKGELGNGAIGGADLCSDGKCVKEAVSTIASGIDEIAGAGSFIGGAHFCARTASRRVSCWGQLAGSGTTTTPTEIAGLDDAVQIASGIGFDCAMRVNGTVSCWGSNAHGQLGQGDFAVHAGVVDVAGLAGVTTIGAGGSQVCARAVDKLYCWGANTFGQLGNGSLDDIGVPLPTLVAATDGLEEVVQIVGAPEATCALTGAGLVYCWGRSDYGLLGSGKNVGMPCAGNFSCLPVPTKAKLGVTVEIALGGSAGLARGADGALYAWGGNAAGQLGNKDVLLTPSLPTKIASFQ